MKRIIAIDIDEVLAPHNEVLARFHNYHFGTSHSVDDYHDNWKELWGVDHDEAERRAVFWHASDDIKTMKPLKGAINALKVLKNTYELVIVTGRSRRVAQLTEDWLEQHFAGIFREIKFIGIWEEGRGRTKVEACLEIGADFLIEDSLVQAKTCAAKGVKVLLFGDYNWNKADSLPKNVTRVKDWQEVLEYFDHEKH